MVIPPPGPNTPCMLPGGKTRACNIRFINKLEEGIRFSGCVILEDFLGEGKAKFFRSLSVSSNKNSFKIGQSDPMITLPDILFTKITKGHGKVVKVQSPVKGRVLLPLKNPTDSLLPHQSQADQGNVASVGIHGIFFNLSCPCPKTHSGLLLYCSQLGSQAALPQGRTKFHKRPKKAHYEERTTSAFKYYS